MLYIHCKKFYLLIYSKIKQKRFRLPKKRKFQKIMNKKNDINEKKEFNYCTILSDEHSISDINDNESSIILSNLFVKINADKISITISSLLQFHSLKKFIRYYLRIANKFPNFFTFSPLILFEYEYYSKKNIKFQNFKIKKIW